MRLIFGTIAITTAGTRQQVSNTKDRVMWIKFQGDPDNTQEVYFGTSGVSATAEGYALKANNEQPLDFGAYGREGSVEMSVFWVDADVNGEIIRYVAILR